MGKIKDIQSFDFVAEFLYILENEEYYNIGIMIKNNNKVFNIPKSEITDINTSYIEFRRYINSTNTNRIYLINWDNIAYAWINTKPAE